MIKEIIYVSVIIIYVRWWDLYVGVRGRRRHDYILPMMGGRADTWKSGGRVAGGVTGGCKSPGAEKGDDEKEPGLISLGEEKF